MKQSIVMFHIGRSGSRVAGNLLDQHPQIEWLGEALKPEWNDRWGEQYGQDTAVDTPALVEAFSANRSKSWLGLEVKFFHLVRREISLADFVQRVSDLGCEHFAVLRRENMLRKIVSSMVAKQKRRYHNEPGAKPELTQITIDTSKVEIDGASKPLVDYLDSYQASFDELDELLAGKQTLALTYEADISTDPRNAFGKVCDFAGLGRGDADPEVAYGKTNPFPLAEIVTNIDDVRASLAGTSYAWMTEA